VFYSITSSARERRRRQLERPGSLSISGAGTLPGTTAPPVNGSDIGAASGTVPMPTFPTCFNQGQGSLVECPVESLRDRYSRRLRRYWGWIGSWSDDWAAEEEAVIAMQLERVPSLPQW